MKKCVEKDFTQNTAVLDVTLTFTENTLNNAFNKSAVHSWFVFPVLTLGLCALMGSEMRSKSNLTMGDTHYPPPLSMSESHTDF